MADWQVFLVMLGVIAVMVLVVLFVRWVDAGQYEDWREAERHQRDLDAQVNHRPDFYIVDRSNPDKIVRAHVAYWPESKEDSDRDA